MGTDSPQVTISAATLAGGEKNQDRYAYGDGWAFVLDGASSFDKTKPEHDGGQYAERLKLALSAGLSDAARSTPEVVARAIRSASEAYSGADSCPTSTIAMARWCDGSVEVFVLGDSTAVLISTNGEEVISDARLATIGRGLREQYRSRLRDGCGFDAHHRDILRRLQAKQALARNQPGGYWIAGSAPDAARHAITSARPARGLNAVILATDGAASGLRYGVFNGWTSIQDSDLHQALLSVHRAESADPKAERWPRSKIHDDKTVVTVTMPPS